MIMQGLQFTGKPPFHTIYLHGLVRDEHGHKMSKTAGNVVDPLEVMDEYGTDALRFTLLTGSTPGNDMNLSLEKVAANRNFSNKIWNATRFVVSNLQGDGMDAGSTMNLAALSLADNWIMSRLNRLIGDVTRLIDEYNFGEAGRQMYDFFWSEFADWYIEIAKIRMNSGDRRVAATTRQTLTLVLERILRLMHPYIPFITEAAWQHLPHTGDTLMLAQWPQAGMTDEQVEADMNMLINIIRVIRNARSEYSVEPGKRITALIAAGEKAKLIARQKDILTALAKLDAETFVVAESLPEKPVDALTIVAEGGIEIYLPLAGMVDIAAERERLQKELSQVEQGIARTEKMLANENFVSKAPAAVVDRERNKLADLQAQAAKLRERLASLK